MQVLAIAAGGAIGALMRYWVSMAVHQGMGKSFPYGTLTVNVAGSLLIGILYVVFNERIEVSPYWRALLMVGMLGAFTTFSTFSIETLELMEKGDMVRAGINVLSNVILCITAAWLGLLVTRLF